MKIIDNSRINNCMSFQKKSKMAVTADGSIPGDGGRTKEWEVIKLHLHISSKALCIAVVDHVGVTKCSKGRGGGESAKLQLEWRHRDNLTHVPAAGVQACLRSCGCECMYCSVGEMYYRVGQSPA